MATPIGVVIPLDETGLANYTFGVQLDGTDYVMRIMWNTREGRWYLDLLDANEVPIWTGLKLVANSNLLRRCVSAVRPPGVLSVVVLGTDDDPGFLDFGQRASLTYFSAAEVAASRALTSPPT